MCRSALPHSLVPLAKAPRHTTAAVIVLLLATLPPGAVPPARGAPPGVHSELDGRLTSGAHVAPFTGAATLSIPIAGVRGEAARDLPVALTYSSRSGASPYGYGWALVLGRVERSTRHGLLSCTDDRARNEFVVILPRGRIACTLEAHSGRCRPHRPTPFAHIVYTPNRWEVSDDHGVRYQFGVVASERTGSDVTALFQPGPSCRYTFSWALRRVEDTDGNAIEIRYAQVDGVLYPDSIRYTDNGVQRLIIDFAWHPRPLGDELLDGRGGFPARLTRLLSQIDVRPADNTQPAWSYTFGYDTDSGQSGHATLLREVTRRVGRDGVRDLAFPAPPRLRLTYRRQNLSLAGFGPFQDRFVVPPGDRPSDLRKTEATAAGGSQRTVDVLDMNGDGFPDQVVAACDGTWLVYFGSRGGFSSVATRWLAPAGALMCALSATVPQEHSGCGERVPGATTIFDTVDIDGDGVADFVDARTIPWKVYRGSPSARPGQWGFRPAQDWPAERAGVRHTVRGHFGAHVGRLISAELRDMNGDHVPDFVEAWPGNCDGHHWQVWRNTGSGFGTPEPLAAPSNTLGFTTEARPPFAGDAAGVERDLLGTLDMNGDGLPDYVYAADAGHWAICPYSGSHIGPCERWPMASFGRGAASLRVTLLDDSGGRIVVRDLIDVNGDGLPDIVDASGGGTAGDWRVRLNSGRGFSEVLSWPARLPAYEPLRGTICSARGYDARCRESVEFADTFDVDGDGLADHVNDFGIWHNAAGAWAARPYPHNVSGPRGVTENPDAGPFAALVAAADDSTTHLFYRPSTQWDNSDPAGVPQLPFVLWTVSAVERDRTRTDLRYAHGRFEPQTREFQGFEIVEERGADETQRTTCFFQDEARRGDVRYSYVVHLPEAHAFAGTTGSVADGGRIEVIPIGSTP